MQPVCNASDGVWFAVLKRDESLLELRYEALKVAAGYIPKSERENANRIVGQLQEVRRKGGKVHRVALPDSVRASLLARCHRSGYVFGEGAAGEPPTQQTASNRIIRALANLGLAGVTHHTMRHTGVTMMLESGINPRVIQLLAGWTSLRMLERYGHVRAISMTGRTISVYRRQVDGWKLARWLNLMEKAHEQPRT